MFIIPQIFPAHRGHRYISVFRRVHSCNTTAVHFAGFHTVSAQIYQVRFLTCRLFETKRRDTQRQSWAIDKPTVCSVMFLHKNQRQAIKMQPQPINRQRNARDMQGQGKTMQQISHQIINSQEITRNIQNPASTENLCCSTESAKSTDMLQHTA